MKSPICLRAAFQEGIQGMMLGRTRVLVTNRVEFVHAADWVIVMDGKGGLAGVGTPADLTENCSEFRRLVSLAKSDDASMNNDKSNSSSGGSATESTADSSEEMAKEKEATKALVKTEERATGAVQWRIVK